MYSKSEAGCRLGVFAVLAFYLSIPAFPADVKVAWDANTELVLAGYKVYHRTASGAYEVPIDVGNFPTGTIPNGIVPGLLPGTKYYIAVTAYSIWGLESGKSVEVSYTPPAVAISSPATGGTYYASSSVVSLAGTSAGDPGIAQVTWSNDRGGSGNASGTNPWSVTDISLQAGVNVLTITAANSLGYTESTTLNVVRDTAGPTVTVLIQSANGNILFLSGSASDLSDVTQVTWANSLGGSGTASGTTNWSISDIPLQVGVNTITLTATDFAGNKGIAITEEVYPREVTTPTITITSPAGGGSTYYVNTSTVALAGTATGYPAITQVTWTNSRGGGGTTTGVFHWSVDSIPLLSGENVITVTGTTATGGSVSAILKVICDTEPPTLKILQQTQTSDIALELTGTVSDPYGIERMTWATDRGLSGAAEPSGGWSSPTVSWSIPNIPIHFGSNNITLTVWDFAGNVATEKINLENSPPPLAITGVAAMELSETSIQIRWTTNSPSDSLVEFGIGDPHGNSNSDSNVVTSHSVSLTNLVPRVVYGFHVRSRTPGDRFAVSDDYQFIVGAGRPTLFLPHLFTPGLTTAGAGAPGLSDSREETADNPEYVGLALTNLNSTPANLTFIAFDSSGELISGDGITNPARHTLQPGEQWPVQAGDLFGFGSTGRSFSGSVRVQSDADLVTGFFLTYTGDYTEQDGANLTASPMSSFLLPEITEQGYTKINIVNGDLIAGTLQLDLVKSDGTVRATKVVSVASGGSVVADVYGDLFTSVAAVASDYIRGSSSGNLVPYEMTASAGKDTAILAGLDLNRGGTALYAPQYVVGGTWMSTLTIVNVDSEPGSVTLKLFGDDGIQIGASQTRDIPAFGKLYVDDPNFFGTFGQDLTQGCVQVISGGIRLAGSIRISGTGDRRVAASLPLIATLQTSLLFGQVASGDTYFTGITILNPNSADNQVTIELYNPAGQLQYSRQLTIQAWRRVAGALTEFFPEIIGQNLDRGYVRVKAHDGVVGFALFGTNDLSVLSAISAQFAP